MQIGDYLFAIRHANGRSFPVRYRVLGVTQGLVTYSSNPQEINHHGEPVGPAPSRKDHSRVSRKSLESGTMNNLFASIEDMLSRVEYEAGK